MTREMWRPLWCCVSKIRFSYPDFLSCRWHTAVLFLRANTILSSPPYKSHWPNSPFRPCGHEGKGYHVQVMRARWNAVGGRLRQVLTAFVAFLLHVTSSWNFHSGRLIASILVKHQKFWFCQTHARLRLSRSQLILISAKILIAGSPGRRNSRSPHRLVIRKVSPYEKPTYIYTFHAEEATVSHTVDSCTFREIVSRANSG